MSYRRSIGAFAAFLIVSACYSSDYYVSYMTTCSIQSNSIPGDIRHAAEDLSSEFNLPVKTTVDRPDMLVLVLDLPLLPNAPSYRPNSSGQIILSYNKDGKNSKFNVVIVKNQKKRMILQRKFGLP